jgi:hypothetical protein
MPNMLKPLYIVDMMIMFCLLNNDDLKLVPLLALINELG